MLRLLFKPIIQLPIKEKWDLACRFGLLERRIGLAGDSAFELYFPS